MKNKKILCCFVSTLLFGLFIVPVMAAESSNQTTDGKYIVSVTCNANGSSHTINARNGATYPMGKAYVTYSVSGSVKENVSVNGASYRSYWTASRPKKSDNETFINATTSGYGIKVYTSN